MNGIVNSLGGTNTSVAPGTPRIVSSRFDEPQGHTLEGYRSTGSYRGYEGLRAVLDMGPDEASEMVKERPRC